VDILPFRFEAPALLMLEREGRRALGGVLAIVSNTFDPASCC
jgi:hypothetical protein